MTIVAGFAVARTAGPLLSVRSNSVVRSWLSSGLRLCQADKDGTEKVIPNDPEKKRVKHIVAVQMEFSAQSTKFERHAAVKYQKAGDWVVSHLMEGLPLDGRALDVCCGTGQLARNLAATAARKVPAGFSLSSSLTVTGMDITEAMMKVGASAEVEAHQEWNVKNDDGTKNAGPPKKVQIIDKLSKFI